MVISYKNTQVLIDLGMKKKVLVKKVSISIAKKGKDSAIVSCDVLVKICTAFDCTMDNITEVVLEKL